MAKPIGVAEIVAHIIEVHKPQDGPVVLMWKDLINAIYVKETGRPLWSRSGREVHEHFKKYGPTVLNILAQTYKLTIVKVSTVIIQPTEFERIELPGCDPEEKPVGGAGLKHAARPDRSYPRTDELYRGCISNTGNPTMGIVAFPPGTKQSDHPLIKYSLRGRMKAGSSHFMGVVKSVDTANDLGTLSAEARKEIRKVALPAVRQFTEESLPMFPRSIDEPDRKALDHHRDDDNLMSLPAC